MRITRLICTALAAIAVFSCKTDNDAVEPVNFSEVRIDDGFWTPRLENHKRNTIPVCIDQIENETGRIRNFENAARHEGEHSGIFFDDSDVYKALEGFAYSLVNEPDSTLEAICDEWISKFAAAQEDDGYINTFYSLTGLENRWSDMNMHEMYCAGHMIEAAVAYYQATDKKELLEVSERMVAHMMSVFGPGKRHWVPGHEEIELALVKLYNTTHKREYLDFASWLLEERGHGHGRGAFAYGWEPAYFQDDVPVAQMKEIKGHAVRLMYLLCGMADVASCTDNQEYRDALMRMWEAVVERNMYITGGIGASHSNEGFDGDYYLPNLDAYCETCASVGMVLWNWRMNLMTGESRFADILEKSLYNGVLSGESIEGDRFFYVNPLESDGLTKFNQGLSERAPWYGCACCPSQLCRFIPSIGNYIYCRTGDVLWINLYIGNECEECSIKTSYPWEGTVEITLDKAARKDELRLRIPGWCKDFTLTLNGKGAEYTMDRGYAVLKGRWRRGDRIVLDMDMTPKTVTADPRVIDDVGKVAVTRGPLVYCIEQIDNEGIDDAVLPEGTGFAVSAFDPGELGGIVRLNSANGLSFVPYYSWNNRGVGKMKVWINKL